jgi:hypothetical protein
MWKFFKKISKQQGKFDAGNEYENKSGKNTKDIQSNIRSTDGAELYRNLAETILILNGSGGSIVFAGYSKKSLPVTVPVNTAMLLASMGKRCLLIDMDTQRDAIAKAFSIEPLSESGDNRIRPRKTDFENLTIWPAHNFLQMNKSDARVDALAEVAGNKFDTVLINAPNIANRDDRLEIMSSAKYALIFANKGIHVAQMAALAKAANCKLIGNIQSTQ